MSVDLAPAIAALRSGGIIAYPTEAVWGVGCDPFERNAVERLLAIKQRPVEKGLILLAGEVGQLAGLVDWDALPPGRRELVLASWPGPHTWVVPATPGVPAWVTGAHRAVAVRVSAHPVAASLSRGFGAPLVSTSANLSGQAPARTREALDPALLSEIDAVTPGETGNLPAPTPIRDARDLSTLRN